MLLFLLGTNLVNENENSKGVLIAIFALKFFLVFKSLNFMPKDKSTEKEK